MKRSLSTLSLTRQGTQSELNDLIGSRTEVECTIADLHSSSDADGGKRAVLESDLTAVENQIKQKEKELGTVLPQWEAHRAKESREKRKAQEASTRLEALFAKQGRVNRFRTKAERDNFLENEVTSLGSYQATRTSALETTRTELDSARQSLAEVQERMEGVQGRMEDGRKRTNDLTEQIKSLKEDQVDLVERRKELWREDTRLQSLVTHASDEKRSAENNLASMMDKVWLHL